MKVKEEGQKLTRRQLLRGAAAAGVGLALPMKFGVRSAMAVAGSGIAMWQTQKLTRWVDPLPIMPVPVSRILGGGSEIVDPINPTVMADYYSMECRQSAWQFHSQLPATQANSYWCSGSQLQYTGVGAPIDGYLGPSILAVKGKAVVLDMANKLPMTPLYANAWDGTIGNGMAGTMYSNTSRIAVHLHGGFTPPAFDGHPDAWFGPGGAKGTRYASLPGAPVNGYRYWFSNQQDPCLLWYHDHSMFQTRLNPFAGQAAGYVIMDGNDTVVPGLGGLNVPKFPYDVPLVIQDRTFYSDGSMFYPTSSGVPAPYPHPIWQPEYFGDTPVVNGKAYPVLQVEARRYRLRFLNGSNARFYELSLGLPMWVIGTEQGLLPRPVPMKKIVIAPAERTDVIVDFGGLQGQQFILGNTAKAPYPTGRAVRIPQIMLFAVKQGTVTDTTADPAKGQLSLPAFTSILPPPAGTPTRDMVLKETIDPATGVPIHVRINGLWFEDPIDDFPRQNSIEIWNWVNLTADTHPMHPHLVKFQVLGRLPLNVAGYDAAWTAWIAAGRNPATKPQALAYATGPLQAPGPDEIGWKDTVKANTGMITQIVAKFEVPPGSVIGASGGYEYIEHCHILEHEENEMMRPYAVLP